MFISIDDGSYVYQNFRSKNPESYTDGLSQLINLDSQSQEKIQERILKRQILNRKDKIATAPKDRWGKNSPPSPPVINVNEFRILYFLSRMAKFANMAYCFPENNDIGFGVPGAVADVIWNKKFKELVAYFKGRDMNLKREKIDWQGMSQYNNHKGLYVNKIWFNETKVLMKSLTLKIGYEIRSHGIKKFKLCFIGHGLGGVYAVLAGLIWTELTKDTGSLFGFWKDLEIDFSVITFGQPRIGNPQLANYINLNLKDKIFRVTNKNDPIPRFPMNSDDLPYFIHHELEFWISKRDCDCETTRRLTEIDSSYNLYECRGIWEHDIGNAVGENPDCNVGASPGNSLAHFGPYFGTTMNNCKDFQL
ncbi:hypothetical protein G9A89_006754 [Geosiphon pyriformis]|nr:hypothetical protein G9A89_006754 [Geosiphon pyriformis]